MTAKNSAYETGYKLARIELEVAKPKRNRKTVERVMKETIREFAPYDKVLEGVTNAMWDYEHEVAWEF